VPEPESGEPISIPFDAALLNLLRDNPPPQGREWYIFPRSIHWANHFLEFRNAFLDQDFQQTFRMSRDSFEHLHQILEPHIQRQDTQFRNAIPSKRRLAIFLYHITLGTCYTGVSNQFGIGRSTVSNIIGQVAEAICMHMFKRFVRFSTTEDCLISMEFWKENNHIPGVVGCIDGTHIRIKRPVHNGQGYYNRKGYYSMNVQGISHFTSITNCFSCCGSQKAIH